MSTEKATFGAGCFWGVEAAFAAIPGVTATAVGYEGGALARPSYKDVCTDQTGHAEVVEVDFDPEKLSYEKLLDAFFSLHDPTTLNRQGTRLGHAIPLGHLLPLPGAGKAGPRKNRAAHRRRPLQSQAHRHQGRARPNLLACGRIPPALFRKARPGKLPYLRAGVRR